MRRAVELLRGRSEVVPFALLIIASIVSTLLSPYFFAVDNLRDMTSQFMEEGLMALPMTMVIICANIDLSVGSILGLVSLGFGLRYVSGWPIELDMIFALALGASLGGINGLLVTRLRLPSLVVTLGTLALFRGMAQVLDGDGQVSSYPDWFVGIDQRYVLGIPAPLLIFAGCAIVFGLVLHRTTFGRLVYAIGSNEEACRFSAIPVDRIKLIVFVLSGLMSGAGAVMITSRLGSSRWDVGLGFELDVITAVVLGGTDIFGGKGSILGTLFALFTIGVVRNGMGLANYNGDEQSMVIGALLVLSILVPNIIQASGLFRFTYDDGVKGGDHQHAQIATGDRGEARAATK
jgi:rhamnose transport system permease protein